MSGRSSFVNLACYMMSVVIMTSILSLIPTNTFAKENHYQFDEVIQLNDKLEKSSQWLQLIASPSNTQQYFVVNNTGQMYLADETQALRQVLNLNINTDKGLSDFKLTAFELHPNFALRDQLGYGIFYTAHIESLDVKSSTKRIQENNDNFILKYDAVITEWEFNSSNYQAIDSKTKREVLRIAVPDDTMTINQMSFSPFTKSWNEGFGLLYIALSGHKKWQKPLYSGVILRINPAKFGLRSFTVPTSNPYIKESEIKDEIYVLGGQDIKQFIWPNKNSEDILLSHRYDNKFLLSLTNIKNDWRDKASEKIFYQNERTVKSSLLYRGSRLVGLRNKLLILTQDKQGWLVNSLNLLPLANNVTPIEERLQEVWRFTSEQLAYDSDVSFSNNRDGEVFIIDKTQGTVFQVFPTIVNQNTVPKEESTVTVENQVGDNQSMYMILTIVFLIVIIVYVVKRNKFSAKAIVRKQFAQIELSESQQQIGFYYRHSKNIDTMIALKDVTTFEVKLNGVTVNFIDQSECHGFDNDKEQDLRAIFTKETIDKMIAGKIRQINLSLTDTQNKNYVVCLYMRKGSDRVTKKTYSVVIEDVIDWCWLMAENINPDSTDVRKPKPTISTTVSAKNIVEQNYNKTILHDQAIVNRLSAYQQMKSQHRADIELPKEVTIQEEVYKNDREMDDKQTKRVDTYLVNALEKLVDLRQQGFLTEEEFIKTKENLLLSLSEK